MTTTATPPAAPTPSSPPKDSLRETLDTIVTVVVVVLLLRTYVAEAFMIPTGSMATTLYGYQKHVHCPQCGFYFPVDCSTEREPQNGTLVPVNHCVCPNCLYGIVLPGEDRDATCSSGDRVLVAKYLYDWTTPQRLDVVVFKNPKEPQVRYDPLNFIKRLVGLPGETIAISDGNLYVSSQVTYANEPKPSNPNDLWKLEYTYKKDGADALELFRKGGFQIVRKPPAKVIEMSRPVYDNDQHAQDLSLRKFPPRWAPESAATADSDARVPEFRRRREAAEKQQSWLIEGAHGFRHPARQGELAWLCYRHLPIDRNSEVRLADLNLNEVRPQLIADFLGYAPAPPSNWVGDLILECEVTVEQAEGQLVLELARGVDLFQARWDLAAGSCSLVRLNETEEKQLATQPSVVKAAGTYRLRFANVDERLIVWVDNKLVFGDGVAYDAASEFGPRENDLRPASIGAHGGGVRIRHLKLWRDTYYTLAPFAEVGFGHNGIDWGDPNRWTSLQDRSMVTFYVQPGHYFCMGDNSLRSSDSRAWGLVPQRLLLGRALLTYYPISRMGRIR